MSKKRPFIGSSVVNGKIRYSSVSAVKTFDPASDGCPRKWAFQYPFQKKLLKTAALEGGIDNAEKLEWYLKSDENVLPPVLQPAQKFYPTPRNPKTGLLDLEVEQPLGDIEKAVYYRDAYLKLTLAELANPALVAETLQRMQRFAGLTACGIPLEGAADFRHHRGEYIDEEGVLRAEAAGAIVVETGDQKVISLISSRTTSKGLVLQGWAKTSAQVCADSQMVGYARAAVDKYPDATHHRLSHIYAQKSAKGAAKRTGIISVAQVLERWHGVEQVVGQMVQAATAQKIEDVEPNTNACDSFTHVSPEDGKTTLKGCGHRYYCPLGNVVFQNMLGQHKESAMSLFDTLDPSALPAGMTLTPAPSTAPVPPPAPPVDRETERALIEFEKARLRAEDHTRVACPIVGCGVGCQPGWLKTGSDGGFVQCLWPGHTPQFAAPPPPAAPAIGVTPPDAPPPAPLLHAAAPLPPAALAEITDPALRATVEQHAAEHARLDAEKAAKEQAEKVAAGTNIWCSESGQRIVLTMEMALARKYTCSCTKIITLKPAKQEDGIYQATLPRHKPANKTEAPTPPQLVPPPPPVVQEMVPPPPPEMPEMSTAPAKGMNGHSGAHIVAVPPQLMLLASIDTTLKELLAVARSVVDEALAHVEVSRG